MLLVKLDLEIHFSLLTPLIDKLNALPSFLPKILAEAHYVTYISPLAFPHTPTHTYTPSCLHEDGYQWQPLFSLASSPFLLCSPNHIQQGSPVPRPPSHTQKAEPCLNPAALINLSDFVNYLFGWLTASLCVREHVPLWSIWDACHGWNNPSSDNLEQRSSRRRRIPPFFLFFFFPSLWCHVSFYVSVERLC